MACGFLEVYVLGLLLLLLLLQVTVLDSFERWRISADKKEVVQQPLQLVLINAASRTCWLCRQADSSVWTINSSGLR
jgi:hypothetical protein